MSDTKNDTMKLTTISSSSSSSSSLSSSSSSLTPVKSTAVVKYSAVQSPATFAQLQCNTNLNLPPSNWLSSSAESYGLQSVWSHSTGFTSFRMAHMFPDCVGEVDVVSDAKNIKKLLKMPYSHEVVSMMVHRIENTLLLDDFDIKKYLLRQAESDWEWLKEFFYQNIFQRNNGEKEKRLFNKTNSRNTLQQKNLVSKFLYHSLVIAENQHEKNENPPLPLNKLEPNLPEPTNEEKLPDPNHNHNFARNVVWTFENIQMLIGTDMPIFGGQTHPCISLRLRDMKKPINVLTGIDYWLDNLMCNVPEVVMCYHLDGIVKKYELIKTEDLPNLNDAKFNPKVIRDVAQNILSFLKTNATKSGHTYWLFKGKDDDVVKLYDLTSLCSEISDDKAQNPFTVPVAMLLYRVARNMKYSVDNRTNHGTIRMLLKNCIQLLNCKKYPQIVTSAHYMLSDLYVPADTDPSSPILVDQCDDDANSTSECDTNNYENDDINSTNDNSYSVSATIMSLALAQIKDEPEQEESKYKPPPISGSVAERCRAALDHVSIGLECLKYFPIDDGTDDESKKSEYTNGNDELKRDENNCQDENLKTARPFEAIPMPYISLDESKIGNNDNNDDNSSSNNRKRGKKRMRKEKVLKENCNSKEVCDAAPKALLCKMKVDTLPTWQAPKKSDNSSWKSHLKTLLYEKASLIFAVLVEYEYTNQQYGGSLKYILAVLKCQKILEIFCQIRNNKLISYLLGRAGDCCLMTVQDWRNIDVHKKTYHADDEVEEKIVSEILEMEDLDMRDTELLPETLESLEATLAASHKYYERALAFEPLENDKNNLLRRLGNIHNELGVLYMNQAATKYHQDELSESVASSSTDVTHLLTRSLIHLEAGVKSFETVRDEANLALLHSNTGRLMRLCAHMHTKKQTLERNFYNKALINYQKALQVLGSRKTNPSIWDTVIWDLSTTLFTMATLLQDYPKSGNKTDEELEREVVDLFQKALKYCDTETPGPRQPVYQFRAATIQHRLASLYHHVYRGLEPDNDCTRRKTNLQLSKLYYEKAAKLLMSLEQSVEFLTVQLERVALFEHQAQTSTTFNGKLKAYQNGVELILQCESMLEVLSEKNKAGGISEKDNNESAIEDKIGDEHNKQNEDEDKLILLLEQRFQYLLRSLTKLFISKSNTSNTKKEYESIMSVYKMAYSRTLRAGNHCTFDSLKHVISILQEVGPKLREIQDIH